MSKTITVEDLWQFARIGALSLSPDGSRAVVALTNHTMSDNLAHTQLWLLPTSGGQPRALTHCGEKDAAPAFSPDGQQVAFTAQRDQQGRKDSSPQLYLMAVDGGEARRVSQFAPGVGAFRWMPNGRQIVFVAWVWPELRGSKQQNMRQTEWDERKESGYVTSEMQYRYWNANLPQGRVAHLHLMDLASGRITDLFEGTRYELPRDEPGLGCFDVSPDGRGLLFMHDPALIKSGGNRCELVQLVLRGSRFETMASHKHWDFSGPRFSPDGQQIAAVATQVVRSDTPFGHTANGQLAVWPSKRPFSPRDARDWTHDVQSPLHWEADGSAIWLAAEDRGRCHAWRHGLAASSFAREVEGGWVQGLAIAGSGAGATVVTVRDSIRHPARVFARQGGTERRLESFNDAVLRRLRFGRVEEHVIKGALGDDVQLWAVYPPGFSGRGRHPAMHVIHGGPYTAAGDTFSYRWNPHLLASQGHVVVQVNYHGSSGFGQRFRSSIMGRQGELELQDLKAGTEWILRQPWADASRVYATGASYGGYLVAWMNGQWKPWPQGPIRAYVCHAGVFDRRATWSADSYTQRHRDLGATYWADSDRVAAQSPVTFAGQMNTPTLVIHGAQDYRVPDHNGLAYYNTLKARGVDARLLWFPDEGHWVLKARNSRQWYGEFLAWLQRHGAPLRLGGKQPGRPLRKAARKA